MSSSEKVIKSDSIEISSIKNVTIPGTLKNLNSESNQLYQSFKESTNVRYEDSVSKSNSEAVSNYSKNHTLRSNINASVKSRPIYKEEELQQFAKVLKRKLNKYIAECIENSEILCSRRKLPDFCIEPVSEDSKSGSSTIDDLEYCLSDSKSTVSENTNEKECEFRSSPINFRHFGDLLTVSSDTFKLPQVHFKLNYVGKCEHIGKWGEFLKLVDRILEKRDLKMTKIMAHNENVGDSIAVTNNEKQFSKDNLNCCNDVCIMPSHRNNFEDLDRFKDIEFYAFSTLCLNLLKWSNCTTKRWNSIRNKSHLVIHMPSLSYPCHLRCTARMQFESLQNIQIGRIGWLVNENADVLYICPGKSNLETKFNLINFIRIAKPDLSLSRLWIIENDDECLSDKVDKKYRSGCENLFYTPTVYQRVRHLSAGRSGFIIPGILSKTDLLIACELKTPIIGPCLMFQERLLNKHYVMSVLAEANIQRPPFIGIRNFLDLCAKMSEMIIWFPQGFERKWLLKINCGFCGNQSALIHLNPDEYCRDKLSKEELRHYLTNVLPHKLIINKRAYKNSKDFFVEMERQDSKIKNTTEETNPTNVVGALLIACPTAEYRTVSLGCFIEHDMAKACLRTAADVIQTFSETNCSWSDAGYIIPQTTLPNAIIQELTHKVGDALLSEQYIGFFGVDIVVFRDEDSDGKEVLNYWVVDIDPYYTDLLSFDDWRRFCLNISHFECMTTEDDFKKLSSNDSNNRFVVCSGKLSVDGLTLSCNNFFIELCKRNKIAYSYKAKTGCMIYPINNKKTTFLLFSFYRSKEMALKLFVSALKALYYSPIDKRKFIKENYNNMALKLARDMQIIYNIAD